MKEYLTFLLTKTSELIGENASSGVSPRMLKDLEELDESGKITGPDCKPWPKYFTPLFLSILLISKEILAQLDVHPLEPNSSEACFGDAAYLVQFVEEGVKMLWEEIRVAESQLLKALVTRFATSNPGSPAFSFCCEIVDKTLESSKRLNCHVDVASGHLSKLVYRNVAKLLNPHINPLTQQRDSFCADFRRVLTEMQMKHCTRVLGPVLRFSLESRSLPITQKALGLQDRGSQSRSSISTS